MKLVQQTDNLQDEQQVMEKLGSSYYFLGDAHKAVNYYQKVLKIARKRDDAYSQAVALNNLSLLYEDLGHNNLAAEYIKKALKIMIKLDVSIEFINYDT